tara:strand:- start:518 stop:754 length:237 start_codon:yes stop_codon:yes gene_type:complete
MWCGFLPSAIYLIENSYSGPSWPIISLYMLSPFVMYIDCIASVIYKRTFNRRIKQKTTYPKRREEDLLAEKKTINTYA